MLRQLWDRRSDPVIMRRVHGWATILWLLAAVPTCLVLQNSVPFLVFISVYAVVTGHWSSWQSTRIEVQQVEDANVQEVLDAINR